MMADYYGLKGQSRSKCDSLQEGLTLSASSAVSGQDKADSEAGPYLRKEHPTAT